MRFINSATSKQYELILGVHILKEKPPNHPNHEYLNPYNYDCLQIAVPHGNRPPISVIDRILHDGQVQAIILAAIAFAISRTMLGLRDKEPDVFLYTIGVCFSQIAIRPSLSMATRRARMQFVWTCSLAVYSAIATAWLSAIVYLKIVSKPEWTFIDSLDALCEANLSVIVPDWYSEIGDWRSHVR